MISLRSRLRNRVKSRFQELLNLVESDVEALKLEGERKSMVRRSIFDQIFKEMQNIRFRLDDLENNISSWNPQPLEISESRLFELPDHLRKSYMTVVSRGECSAVDVSNLTGRCRAIESNYLNQLARMGWVNKRRVSKTTNFRAVSEKMPAKPAEAKAKPTQMAKLEQTEVPLSHMFKARETRFPSFP